jgi:hypothetical protein
MERQERVVTHKEESGLGIEPMKRIPTIGMFRRMAARWGEQESAMMGTRYCNRRAAISTAKDHVYGKTSQETINRRQNVVSGNRL